MGDIIDLYESIKFLGQRQDAIIQLLKDKGLLPKEENKDGNQRKKE